MSSESYYNSAISSLVPGTDYERRYEIPSRVNKKGWYWENWYSFDKRDYTDSLQELEISSINDLLYAELRANDLKLFELMPIREAGKIKFVYSTANQRSLLCATPLLIDIIDKEVMPFLSEQRLDFPIGPAQFNTFSLVVMTRRSSPKAVVRITSPIIDEAFYRAYLTQPFDRMINNRWVRWTAGAVGFPVKLPREFSGDEGM
jgi:hypothetical protein